MQRLAERWDNLDKWVKRVLSLISAIGVIAGLFMGMFSWAVGQLDGYLDNKLSTVTSQIEALQEESRAADKESELSRTRLELQLLISHNPDNTLEIEKVARYYFIDLGGDWYMSGIYSEWARNYGGDTSFVLHKQ